MAAVQTKQCRKCGQVKSFDSFPKNRRECRECGASRKRKWESDNRDHVNQLHRDWAEKNSARSEEIKRKSYTKNRSRILKRLATEYEANPEPVKRRARKRYMLDPVAGRAKSRAWVKANSLRASVHWKNRKARKRNLPNNWTAAQARYALSYWGNACAACGTPFKGTGACHWDHWIPLTNPNCPGTVPENMVPLCCTCNLTKNARDAVAWLKDKFEHKAETIARLVADYFVTALDFHTESIPK